MSFLTPNHQRRKTVAVRKPILSKLEREFPDFYRKEDEAHRNPAASPAPNPSILQETSTASQPIPIASTSGSPPQPSTFRGSPTPQSKSWKSSPLYPPSPFQLAMERQKRERELRRAAKRKSLGDSGSTWSRASSVARSVADDRSVVTSSRGISPALSKSEFARSSMTMSREARKEYENKKRRDFGAKLGMSPPRPTGSMSLYSFGSTTSRPPSRQSNAGSVNTADDIRTILARAKAAREDDVNKRRLEAAERRKEAIRVKLQEEEREKREIAMEQYLSHANQMGMSAPSELAWTDPEQGLQHQYANDYENEEVTERVTKRMRSEESEGYQRMQKSFYDARKEGEAAAIQSPPAMAPTTEPPFFSKQVSASPPRKRGNEEELVHTNNKRHQARSAEDSFISESPPRGFPKGKARDTLGDEAKGAVNGNLTYGSGDSFGSRLSAFPSSYSTTENIKQGETGNSLLETFLGMNSGITPSLKQNLDPDLSGTSTQTADGIFSTQQDNATSTQITEPAADTSTTSALTIQPQLGPNDEKSVPSDIITFHGTKSRSASAEFAKPPPASPKESVQSNRQPVSPTSPAYHTRAAERRLSMSTRRSSQLASSPEMPMSPPTPRKFTQPMVVVDRPPSSHLNSANSTMADAFSRQGTPFKPPNQVESDNSEQAIQEREAETDADPEDVTTDSVEEVITVSVTEEKITEVTTDSSVKADEEEKLDPAEPTNHKVEQDHSPDGASDDKKSSSEREGASPHELLDEENEEEEEVGSNGRGADLEDAEGSLIDDEDDKQLDSDGRNYCNDYRDEESREEEGEEHGDEDEEQEHDDEEEEDEEGEDEEREQEYGEYDSEEENGHYYDDEDEDREGENGYVDEDEDEGDYESGDEEDEDISPHQKAPSGPAEVITIDSDSD